MRKAEHERLENVGTAHHNTIEIGETLSTHKPFLLDTDAVVMGRTFLASVSRFGKSWTNRRLIEQLVGKAGLVIIDPEGEYSSLRPKFSFLIIGKDVPLQLETAEFLAETTLKENLNVIIDLSLTDDDVGKQFVSLFTNRFMFLETTMRKPYLFIVEEADEFMPESGVSKATSLIAMKNLAKKGGKRGVGLVISTHRPAFVSKRVLSQCTTLKMIGRIEWDSDLDVIKEFLQVSSSILRRPRKDGEIVNDGKPHIDGLNPGEFFITGMAVENADFVKVGGVITTHLGATPDRVPPAPKELALVLQRLKDALPEVIEKISPVAVNIEAIKKEAEAKANAKADEKIVTIKRKLEAENARTISDLKITVKSLTERLDSASRQAALGAAPISNPFEHPIVSNNMSKLSSKAQQLLTKVEQMPGQTREQLAAFLTSSKDSVVKIIGEVNRTFKAEVIVDDGGRPVKYRSMLQRLYIQDVGKREINRIQELQNAQDKLRESYDDLRERFRAQESELSSLRETLKRRPTVEGFATVQDQVKTLTGELKQSALQLKKQEQTLKFAAKLFSELDKIFRQMRDAFLTPLPLVEMEKADESPAAVLPEKTDDEKPFHTDDDKIDVPVTLVEKLDFTLREKMFAFLQKHSKTWFTEQELSIALGDGKLFHETFLSLKGCQIIEISEQGVRAK